LYNILRMIDNEFAALPNLIKGGQLSQQKLKLNLHTSNVNTEVKWSVNRYVSLQLVH
jgi:hypothetical protein